MQPNAMRRKHVLDVRAALQVLSMRPPRAHHQLRLARGTQDGGVVAAADRVLH
jgi:hypothetical protein